MFSMVLAPVDFRHDCWPLITGGQEDRDPQRDEEAPKAATLIRPAERLSTGTR